MKKNLFFAMVAAVALASCSNTETIEPAGNEQVAIDFEGNTQNSTRAEIKDVATLKPLGFGVYGYKYKEGLEWTNWDSNAGNVIFKNVKVAGNEAGNWTYTGTKYWDKTTAYKFYAVAPFEDETPNYNLSANGKFTISNVASGYAENSKDYLVDRVVKEEAAAATHNKVAFDFHHTMAKVEFNLIKAANVADDDAVVVKSIKMSGWNRGNGTFAQTKVNGTWTTLDCSEWTIDTTVAGDMEVINGDPVTLTKSGSNANTHTFIMVPQAIAAETLTFTLDYTVNGEPFTAQVGKIAKAQVWGTDSRTTYNLTVGPAAIEFDVTSVCGFDVKSDNEEGKIN